jgi:hypothetical protein
MSSPSFRKGKPEAKWQNGYSDGSGKGTITFDYEPVLRVHWGCSCCDNFDTYSPSTEDKKLIKKAKKLVKFLNENGVKL